MCVSAVVVECSLGVVELKLVDTLQVFYPELFVYLFCQLLREEC